MSQDDLGALGGVKRMAQANYEKGDRSPDADYLAGLAQAGVDVLYVITGQRTPLTGMQLSPQERTLLDDYRRAGDEGRAAACTVLAALARTGPVPP